MATNTKDLCCIQIGYRSLLLPADKGLKAMALLQGALEVNEHYKDGEHTYEIDEPIQLRLEMVRASQVRRAAPQSGAPVQRGLLTVEPLKLPHRRSA